MKTRFFTLILFAACAIAISAQQKKVAVYVTGQESGVNKVLGDQLVSAFTQSGKYSAIERTTSFLAEISKEHNYQRSGAVSDSEIARLGQQFGVQLVCVADISEVFGQKYISARLIDVVTAEVINTANTTSKLQNMDDLMSASTTIASVLTGKTGKEKGAEEKAHADQKADQERIAQQQKDNEYNRIENSLSTGYIEMDNLMVTIPDFALTTYQTANESAKKCRLGGYSNWRLPTKSELTSIFITSRKYHEICSEFPNYRDDKYLTKTTHGYEAYRYWCEGKYYYEIQLYRGEYKVVFGQGTIDDTIARKCFSFFVRNK